MERIIPFGRDYAQSEPFSVDEGQTIRFWIVREDYTTTPGESEVELQVKSAVGEDHWTTIETLTDAQTYLDLTGSDEELVYRWVRKATQASVAVDRSHDESYTIPQAPPPNFVPPLLQPSDPLLCARLKLVLAYDAPVAYIGAQRAFPPTSQVNDFGKITSGTLGGLVNPATGGLIAYMYHPADGLSQFAIQRVGAPSLEAYTGGTLNILYPDGSVQYSRVIADADTTATSIYISFAGGPVLKPGTSLWIVVCPAGASYVPPAPIVNSGRFTLDQNDLPARLSASGFDPDAPFEEVRLFAVENGDTPSPTIIPLTYDEDGEPIRLVDSFRAFTLIAPGEYLITRTEYSNISVFLNTGWKA